jgi:tetratricopeptide (TPR) repeat protein
METMSYFRIIFMVLFSFHNTFPVFADALEKNSELAKIYLERSKQREANDDPEGAEADYQKAHLFDSKLTKKMRPDVNPSIKAEEWILRGDKSLVYLEALACYDKAIQLNPSNSSVYFKKAKLLYKGGHYVNAIQVFNKAIELDPLNSKAYLFRAKAKKALGDKEGYLADIQEYKRVKKQNRF